MFKHILLPTDGSAITASVLKKCLVLAKENGATLTGVHVLVNSRVFAYQSGELAAEARERHLRETEAHARQFLAEIACAAEGAGVACDTLLVRHEQPYQAILDAARERGCDLICMASHGRQGVAGMLLASETQKVLTHSPIPVLVMR